MLNFATNFILNDSGKESVRVRNMALVEQLLLGSIQPDEKSGRVTRDDRLRLQEIKTE